MQTEPKIVELIEETSQEMNDDDESDFNAWNMLQVLTPEESSPAPSCLTQVSYMQVDEYKRLTASPIHNSHSQVTPSPPEPFIPHDDHYISDNTQSTCTSNIHINNSFNTTAIIDTGSSFNSI